MLSTVLGVGVVKVSGLNGVEVKANRKGRVLKRSWDMITMDILAAALQI